MEVKTTLVGLVAGCALAIRASAAFAGFGDLQAAITAARPGDTLRIPSGTYDGNLLIDKRLALIGSGAPIIHGDGNGSVITILADSCVIRGLVIEHSGSMLVNEDAGVLLKSSWNVIAGNGLRDILFGVYLFHTEHNAILENRVAGRAWLGLGERGSGIHIWNSNYNTFAGNTITEVRDGFYFQYASHSRIERNDAFNLRYGLHYMYADSNIFLYNRFYDNVAGAAIMYSRGITMRHNVFIHNRGFSSFGILFQDCHDLRADSNVIADNVVGIFFEASTDNVFRHNIVAQNDVALQMFQNSTDNTFSENNFIDNLSPLAIVGKYTGTRWGENGRGNYWTQYGGYDLDGDGIGDVRLTLQNAFDYLEGQNANTRLYLYSPAAQALAVAAEAFPIIQVSSELENHPLLRPVDLRTIPAVGMAASLRGGNTHEDGKGQEAWIAFPLAGVAIGGLLYRHFSKRVSH